MSRSYTLSHIRIQVPKPMMYKGQGRPIEKKIPDRNRQEHVKHLKEQIKKLDETLETIQKERTKAGYEQIESVLVTVKGMPEKDLETTGLESKKKKIEIVNTGTTEQGEEFAVLRLTKNGTDFLKQKVIDYAEKEASSGVPKHNDVIAAIESFSTSILKDFWVSSEEVPIDKENIWWEVWLLGGKREVETASDARDKFRLFCVNEQIDFNPEMRIEFSDRQVFIINASSMQMSKAITYLDCIAELRSPSKGVQDYLVSSGQTSFKINKDPENILPPEEYAATIAIIDTGINHDHPYLKPAIAPGALHTIDPTSQYTLDYNGHGTNMAGVALYENLGNVIVSNQEYRLPAYIESIRIQLTDESQRQFWGKTTEEAVQKVENENGDKRRIFNMAIGADPVTSGRPSSWSATLDQLCYNEGKGRILTVAAGNVFPVQMDTYPFNNLSRQLDDPAQARNAITVGGVCSFDSISHPEYAHLQTVAKIGGLSPYSASHTVIRDAIKPEVICEAGNCGWDGSEDYHHLEGIGILTTGRELLRAPFVITGMTSPATAEASRILAQIWGANPLLRPETVRGLLIHSASWTKEMRKQFPNKRDLLRTCGYGQPDVNFACRSANSSVTLIAEGQIRPYYREKIQKQTKSGLREVKGKWLSEVAMFELPWPEEILLALGESKVELRVTLSYFSDPNPKNTLRNYEGAGLEWDLQSPDETPHSFFKRVNPAEREKGEKGFQSSSEWEIGKSSRSRGTVQSDRWKGNAVELAARKYLAVYPTAGWWKDKRNVYPDPVVPFSLIVSIVSEDEELNLYNLISNNIDVSIDA